MLVRTKIHKITPQEHHNLKNYWFHSLKQDHTNTVNGLTITVAATDTFSASSRLQFKPALLFKPQSLLLFYSW